MNINSIHAYEGINGKNRRNNEQKNRVGYHAHPLAVRDEVAFKANGNPSKMEQIMNWIKNPNFSFLGKWKEGIETAGFFAMFLIQDVVGMTIPRTWTGLNRDREITGKFHYQEGMEVFGREGLTGPAMMAIPAAVFVGTAAAMGRSTKTNSRLIRTLGNSFKELTKTLANTTKPTEAKVAFYEKNVKQFFNETVGVSAADDVMKSIKDKFISLEKIKELAASGEKKSFKVSDIETEFGFGIDKVKSFLKNESLTADTALDNSQMSKLYKKMQKELSADIPKTIQNSIDDALLNINGSDLSKLNKVRFDNNTYSVGDATDAMIRYADDIVSRNKKYNEMNEAKAEEFKNSMLGKRCVSNLATIAAVLGIMNYLPRLYARSNTPPGETSKEMAANKCKEQPATDVKKGDVAFTGLFSSLGKKISGMSNTALAEGEFHGINFTPTLMTGISILGLTYPRAKRAYDRAPEKDPAVRQNEGWFSRMFKKDASEIKEIAVRDPISALSVTFAVPLLTRWMVKAYEKTSGFVLMNRPDNVESKFKNFLNYINPYSSIEVLGNAELNALYGKIDSHEKLINVCEYLDKKGGDLEKIFAKAPGKDEVFTEFSLKSIKNLDVKEKNAKIMDVIKKAGKENQSKIIDALLPAAEKLKNNKALAAAKTFNSLPFFLNLLVISPFLLGVAIPKYTYKLTQNAQNNTAAMAGKDAKIEKA